MKGHHVLPPAICALGLLAVPLPLFGQTRLTGGSDVALNTSYVWRGITRSAGWVLQGDAVVGARWPNASAVVGGWANLETYSADPTRDLTLGKKLGEWNAWAEFSWWDGPFELDLGYIRYWFDEDSAAAAGANAFDTGEVYADFGLRLGSFVPRVRVWVDFEEVKGAYFELDAAYRLPVFPLAVPSLYLGITGGFSAGQAVNTSDPGQPAYFADDGLTHIDFWTYTQVYLPIKPLSDLYGTVELHFQVNDDPAAKRTSAGPSDPGSDSKFWLGLVLSWYN